MEKINSLVSSLIKVIFIFSYSLAQKLNLIDHLKNTMNRVSAARGVNKRFQLTFAA